MVCDWLHSSHRRLIWRCLHWGIAHSSWWWFYEMTVYTRHLLSRDHSALRAYPFWDYAFTLGHSHLADFDIETPFRVYDCCFRWIIELLTSWVQSSRRTWSDLGTHFPLLHTYTSYIGLCYTCTHLIRALHLLSPHISPSYMTLSFSLDQRKIWTSLELSSWVFTRFWTLGSTYSVMVGPVRLMMYLWWCSHIDSWHVVSWFAYISDLRVLISICLIHYFGFTLSA